MNIMDKLGLKILQIAHMAICIFVFNFDIAFSQEFATDGSVLEYFDVSDGVELTWYHGANSQAKLAEALSGNYMMIEGDITLRWYGYDNQTEEPIMAHPPDVDSDLTFDQWAEGIIAAPGKGMKLDFKNNDVVAPALQILAAKADRLSLPVWINADVVRGPLGGIPRDPDEFLADVNAYFPECTLSLGWTTGCCFADYTRQMMENMWDIVQNTSQPVTYPARAALLQSSWEEFRWMLAQDPRRSSITVWTPSGRDNWEGATEWDMLYCRNDVGTEVIFYDLPGPKFDLFKNISVTAGSLVNYFDVPLRDGLNVTWAHGVNSQAELDEALLSGDMMLEADVILRGEGTENETDIPVMAHPPDTDSDITLHEWLQQATLSQQGIKLDFKSTSALEASLPVLEEMKFEFNQPVMINADIFEGPNGSRDPVNATEFKRLVNSVFPWATLSIGWTTGWDNNSTENEVYTKEMVSEMLEYSLDLVQPITYPVRAVLANASWPQLSRLLDFSRGSTLTVWSSDNDHVDMHGLVNVRNSAEPSRVYYDLPQEQMDEFLDLLNHTYSVY